MTDTIDKTQGLAGSFVGRSALRAIDTLNDALDVKMNRRRFDAAFFFVERMSSCRRKSIPLLVSGQCVWCWSITRSIRL